jgi:hypothetical protein
VLKKIEENEHLKKWNFSSLTLSFSLTERFDNFKFFAEISIFFVAASLGLDKPFNFQN